MKNKIPSVKSGRLFVTCIIVAYCASVPLPSLKNKCFDSNWPGLAPGFTDFSMGCSFRNMLQISWASSCRSPPISRLHPPFYVFYISILKSLIPWIDDQSVHVHIIHKLTSCNWSFHWSNELIFQRAFKTKVLFLVTCCFVNVSRFSYSVLFYSHQPPLNVHKNCSRFLRPIRGFNSV